MNTDRLPVQTPQEDRSTSGPGSGTGRSEFVALMHPKRQGMVYVARRGREREGVLLAHGWIEVLAASRDPSLFGPPCACGCGVPTWGGGKYADPEACRKNAYSRTHPVLDLSGMSPVEARRALRMAEEAVKAAKLGQRRATVDATADVQHEAEAGRNDKRPSNRVRLDAETWEKLGKLAKEFSYSRSAMTSYLIDYFSESASAFTGDER